MTTQKEIAHVLDRAASRLDREGASAKQVWFLAGLIARSHSADRDYNDWLLNSGGLSKGEASALIEGYLNAEKRG